MTPWVKWVLLGLLAFAALAVGLAFAGLDFGENAFLVVGLPLMMSALVFALIFRFKMRH